MPRHVSAIVVAAATVLSFAGAADAKTHRCAADAVEKAKALLRFHAGPEAGGAVYGDGGNAIQRKSVKALKGKGLLDVLEVNSDIYKATYRMRFLYIRSKDDCTLIGQEIFEVVDPY